MRKPEIVALVSERAGITKKAASQALTAFVETIHASLRSRAGKIRIADLGTFRVIEMGARRGVNPRTGKNMTIKAMRLPRFSPAKALKGAVHGTK
jgi:DNA-binding protein HU-beta